MCSISGIISQSTGTGALPPGWLQDAVARMNGALAHRGPDDEGIVSINSARTDLCLGNTRLAIIDITAAGHQPMYDRQTGSCISYNGETYNFPELRRTIGNEFGPWHSSTDTEVVLRAYRKWGTGAFARLRGMFAIAIWDAATQALVLARDRFGIKPLYYFKDAESGMVIFASEVRALLKSGLVPRKLSTKGLASYLNYGSVQAPLTIIEGVESLMPGQFIRIGPTLEVKAQNYETNAPQINHTPRREEAVARLRAELEESVRLHLVSDVPLGVFLSGGMDSSALVALMSRVTAEKPRTFSVIFAEEEFSERSHSLTVARQFKTDHREVHLSEEKLFELLPDALGALDQPSMDGTNTFVVSRAVKDAGVTVALSGLGSDELFGGYPSFARAMRLEATPQITKGILGAASGVGKSLINGTTARQKFWDLARSDGKPLDVYEITRRLFSANDINNLANTSPPAHANGHVVLDTFNTVSQLELSGYMANTLLRDTDSVSMANSLEVRVPFVDSKIVDFVLSLPGDWKSNQSAGIPKPLLAEAVKDLLPPQFLTRAKMGFTLPFQRWLLSRLKNELTTTFKSGGPGLDTTAVKDIWRKFLRAPQGVGWSRPWSLYVLMKWCAINDVRS